MHSGAPTFGISLLQCEGQQWQDTHQRREPRYYRFGGIQEGFMLHTAGGRREATAQRLRSNEPCFPPQTWLQRQ